MSNQYIVDNNREGMGLLTDGNETIYVTQGRHYFKHAVQNVEGYNAIIKPVNKSSNTVNSAMLMDMPVVTPKKNIKKVEE